MNARNEGKRQPEATRSAPHIAASEAALRRAAIRERKRAFEIVGAVPMFGNGEIIWEKADGTVCEESKGIPERREGFLSSFPST